MALTTDPAPEPGPPPAAPPQVALTALYTALGGLAAVIVTDVAQSVLARPRR